MGINIAICETESPKAPCRDLKLKFVKAHVKAGDFVEYQGSDDVVTLDDARKAVGDLEAFFARNRINPESDAVYMEKVKKADDAERLRPYVRDAPTGWVDLTKLDDATAKKVYEGSIKGDAVTAWTLVEFSEMGAICSGCPLSWDKGRGCIGAFGPDDSGLPEIAQKAGCPIVASVPECVRSGRRYAASDAPALLGEIEKLRPALAEDGKMAVRRYSGPLDRMEAMARACADGECGFYFF